jgi:hypothetical protein
MKKSLTKDRAFVAHDGCPREIDKALDIQWGLSRKALTAFSTPVGQDSASSNGFRACAKSVTTLANQTTGLICALHVLKLFGDNFFILRTFPCHVKRVNQKLRVGEKTDVILRVNAFLKNVGVAGFEPTAPTPPAWCATRLRYTPFFRFHSIGHFLACQIQILTNGLGKSFLRHAFILYNHDEWCFFWARCETIALLLGGLK